MNLVVVGNVQPVFPPSLPHSFLPIVSQYGLFVSVRKPTKQCKAWKTCGTIKYSPVSFAREVYIPIFACSWSDILATPTTFVRAIFVVPRGWKNYTRRDCIPFPKVLRIDRPYPRVILYLVWPDQRLHASIFRFQVRGKIRVNLFTQSVPFYVFIHEYFRTFCRSYTKLWWWWVLGTDNAQS